MGQVSAQPARAIRRDEDFFVGEWLVQPSLGLVSCSDTSDHLEPKAMQVLTCLAVRAGSVVSKDELFCTVWPDTYVTEHVLTRAVWQLRQIFGGDFVQTIPRRGYRLTAPVRPASAHIPVLAVLPLANLSGDSDQEYFADGITEALISALAQIGGLRVISRTSVMLYKAKAKPLPQIVAELKVDYVVEGSVIRTGDSVRIFVQLIEAATDQHLWATDYDCNFGTLPGLNDEMARNIANAAQVTPTPEEHSRLARARRVNPVAHDLYLKGRYCYFRSTEESLRMSVDYMQQAIAADPEYALAYTGLATVLVLLSSVLVSALPPIEAIGPVRSAVQRALELDPNLPEAHELLGWMRLTGEWDWAGAEEAYRRAVTLNPSFCAGYGGLAWVYAALNRSEEAIAVWQSCKLDPLSFFYQSLAGVVLLLAGRWQEAEEHLRRIIRLEPNYYYPYDLLAVGLSYQARHHEAIAAAESALRLSGGPSSKAYVGYVYARVGRTGEARKILCELEELAKTRYITPTAPAALLVALGEFDSALDYLEKSQRMRELDICFVRTYPPWLPLHGHPRFQELVRRMKFPD